MLLQRIGIEHLRIWILLLLISLIQAAVIRERRNLQENNSTPIAPDYYDEMLSPEETLQQMKSLCSSRSNRVNGAGPNDISLLCSIMKFNK